MVFLPNDFVELGLIVINLDGACVQRSIRGGTAMSSQAERATVRRQVDPEATQLVEPPRRPTAGHRARGGATRPASAPQRRHPVRRLRVTE